jgi:uncharacterized protein YqjF (DUF2071 family)
MNDVFLRAEWRNLIMANYVIDPNILKPYLPYNTELDLWNNKCYVSLVGFMFLNTKVKGLKIPFHINFEEVNLRFYVKYKEDNIWKRGVVFIKEIVPKPALTFIANTIYKEHYETLPKSHEWTDDSNYKTIKYNWKKNNKWNSISVCADKSSKEILIDSEEEFISEHYWGYTKIDNLITSEYAVEHPRWNVNPIIDYNLDVNFGNTYGDYFSFLDHEKPTSVFLAEGSEIFVKNGKRIKYKR